MKISDIITERAFRIDVRNVTFPVLQNPNGTQVFNYAKSVKHHNLRGLLLGDDIYWWDGEYCLHQEFAKTVGRLDEYNVDNRYELHYVPPSVTGNGGGGYCLTRMDPPDYENENVRRSVDHPNILIHTLGFGDLPLKDVLQL